MAQTCIPSKLCCIAPAIGIWTRAGLGRILYALPEGITAYDMDSTQRGTESMPKPLGRGDYIVIVTSSPCILNSQPFTADEADCSPCRQADGIRCADALTGITLHSSERGTPLVPITNHAAPSCT